MTFNKDSKNYMDWLDVALYDFCSTTSLLVSKLYEQACTMSYQSVEKTMKAFITYMEGDSPESHNLKHLLNECRMYTDELEEFIDIPNQFEGYYYDLRYPSIDPPYVDDEVAEELILIAGNFYNKVKDIIDNIEEQRQKDNKVKYGKYNGYYKWDLTIDKLYFPSEKAFYDKYGFKWEHHNKKLLKEAKRYMKYHMGIDCDLW